MSDDFSEEATCHKCGAPVCNHAAKTLSALAGEETARLREMIATEIARLSLLEKVASPPLAPVLEWTEPIALTGIIMTSGPWQVYRRHGGECLLMIREALVAERLTVDAAKSLAKRLQAVLDTKEGEE
jgi:hypothetical protein